MLSTNGVNDPVVLKGDRKEAQVISRQELEQWLQANLCFDCKNVTIVLDDHGRKIKLPTFKRRPAKVVRWQEHSDGYVMSGVLLNHAFR